MHIAYCRLGNLEGRSGRILKLICEKLYFLTPVTPTRVYLVWRIYCLPLICNLLQVAWIHYDRLICNLLQVAWIHYDRSAILTVQNNVITRWYYIYSKFDYYYYHYFCVFWWVHENSIIIRDLSETHRRPICLIGDPSKTSTCFIGDRHA